MQSKLKIVLILVFLSYLLASIFVSLNKDYIIPITSTGTKDLPPANPSEPAQIEKSITPNGTYLTIMGSAQLHLNVETGGEVFNGRKFSIFVFASWLQKLSAGFIKLSYEVTKELRDNYVEFLLLFLAFTGISTSVLRRRL